MILLTSSEVPITLQKENVYAKRGSPKSVAPYLLLINEDTDSEHDPSYVPPSIHTPLPASRATKGNPEGEPKCSRYLPSL